MPEYDTIISGNIGSGQVGGVHLADGTVGSGSISSGAVGQFLLASGAVNSGHIASGAVVGSVGGGAATIASGTLGPNDLGSGSIRSGAIASGQIGTNHIAQAAIIASLMASGSVLSGAIASGQIGTFHLADNAVTATDIASGAVTSGAIASGQVGNFAISSGAITSGRIGVTAGVPNGTLFLRDDFTWAAAATSIGSGTVGSGAIASGAVQGFFGTTRQIASGTVGVFDFGSGAVVAGTVGSGAIVSGNIASGQIGPNHLGSGAVTSGAIASGQIGTNHISSGSIITYSRNVQLDQYRTAEAISGVRCVQFDLTNSGAVRIAMAAVSGRYPAQGVAFGNALSGQPISVIRYGEVLGPASEIGSGLCISGRAGGRSLWLGASGQLVTVSGGGPTIGVGVTNSGAWGQRMGVTTTSGAVLVDPNTFVQFSGSANITTNPLMWPV